MNAGSLDDRKTTRMVQEFVSPLSNKGAVTVPAAVRRALGIKPKDNLLFRIQDQAVVLAPGPMTLAEARGSVKPRQPDQDLAEIITEAKADHHQRRFHQKIQP